MKETFKAVPGYEGLYEVSDLGNVKGLKSGKIRKPSTNHDGYLQVVLCKNGKEKNYRINRLVYSAFKGTIPDGLHVNHINENKEDNRLCNLNLMTPKENVNWGTALQRMAEKNYKPVIAYKKTGEFFKEFKSITEAANYFGKKSSIHISECARGKRRSAYGYVWKYKNPELN